MSPAAWLDAALYTTAFTLGVVLVHRRSRQPRRVLRARAASTVIAPAVRPADQLPVRSLEELVAATSTASLLAAIGHKTRFTPGTFTRDCEPLLRAFAEFVQALPASECHHHAQPGGLWIHALEVADAALGLRAGIELPAHASTEERKRQEHRWTYAVFAAAMLHDVGKPVTDVVVTLYGDDPRAGRRWVPLAGAMRSFGARWYGVAFVDAGQREYQAHARLAAMLLQSFVPAHVLRWLGEDGEVLQTLQAYLGGEAPDGPLGAIVKRADSDSVRRNLLQGPRTRFASARSVPLIERLMQALRRMAHEGGRLPLNRPGAAGWIHDGCAWLVCGRLADEVRNYLATHESAQGIPGKDRNDRMFDCWQEYGAARPAPEGGAVWRVRVECDGWSPPEPLTVLCFALEQLYEPGRLPPAMNGRVVPVSVPVLVPAAPAGTSTSSVDSSASSPGDVDPRLPTRSAPADTVAAAAASTCMVGPVVAEAPGRTDPVEDLMVVGQPEALPGTAMAEPAAEPPAVPPADDDRLSPEESAQFEPAVPPRTRTDELGAPLRPKEKGARPLQSVVDQLATTGRPPRAPSPAANAFMAWVASAVGTGELAYNEEGALVHFCTAGVLLLSPEIFRRFMSAHEGVADGPVAALRASHGERAFARLQNELARSGWTTRNGDENLHYYSFTKVDGSPSRTAAFYLLPRPQLFWNPVPAPNERIQPAARPRKLALPAAAHDRHAA